MLSNSWQTTKIEEFTYFTILESSTYLEIGSGKSASPVRWYATKIHQEAVANANRSFTYYALMLRQQ